MFQKYLTDTMDQIDGAVGAMFLDWEGESVEVATRYSSPDDLKIIGAYQGIFLNRVNRICSDLEIGRPQQFRLRLRQMLILSSVLRDGYYVVLLLRTGANEGLAWRHLSFLRQQLLREI